MSEHEMEAREAITLARNAIGSLGGQTNSVSVSVHYIVGLEARYLIHWSVSQLENLPFHAETATGTSWPDAVAKMVEKISELNAPKCPCCGQVKHKKGE